MRPTACVLLAAALALGLSAPAPVSAVLINVHFSFQYPSNDPVYAGQTADGSFSFDSSLIPAAGTSVYNPSGLGATSLSFMLDGHTFTTSDADLVSLTTLADGSLEQWVIQSFNTPIPYDGGVFPWFNIRGWAFSSPFLPLPLEFHYATASSPTAGYFFDSGPGYTWSIAEPGTLSLLGIGLVPLALSRRRKG